MTDKEAVERLKNRIIQSKITFNMQTFASKDIEAIQHVLDELEKKDKIIDEMAKCIDIELSSSRLGIMLNRNVKPLESYKEEVKQYFEKKAEEK